MGANTCACMGKAPECTCDGKCRCMCTCDFIEVNTMEEFIGIANSLPATDTYELITKLDDNLNPRLGIVRVKE